MFLGIWRRWEGVGSREVGRDSSLSLSALILKRE